MSAHLDRNTCPSASVDTNTQKIRLTKHLFSYWDNTYILNERHIAIYIYHREPNAKHFTLVPPHNLVQENIPFLVSSHSFLFLLHSCTQTPTFLEVYCTLKLLYESAVQFFCHVNEQFASGQVPKCLISSLGHILVSHTGKGKVTKTDQLPFSGCVDFNPAAFSAPSRCVPCRWVSSSPWSLISGKLQNPCDTNNRLAHCPTTT